MTSPASGVAVGARDSGMTQHVHTLCDALDMPFSNFDPVYLGFPEGADALVAGEVDVQFQCPIPNAVMTDLSQRARVKVVPYREEQIEQVLSKVFFYRRVVMRRGVFRGVDEDIPQFAVLNVLVTHERVDEDLVYALVSTLVRKHRESGAAQPLVRGTRRSVRTASDRRARGFGVGWSAAAPRRSEGVPGCGLSVIGSDPDRCPRDYAEAPVAEAPAAAASCRPRR